VIHQQLTEGLTVDTTAFNGNYPKLTLKAGNQSLVTVSRPENSDFEKQVHLVLNWAELRSERVAEVLTQIEEPYATLSSIVYLQPERTRYTIELLTHAIGLAIAIDMRFKHEFACWRPVEFSPQVQPMITTPGHGAYPSGHATEIYTAVTVLKALLPGPHPHTDLQLDRLAARIATNRVIAGVHFPVDSAAGRLLGLQLGDYFLSACIDQRPWSAYTFDANRFFNDINGNRKLVEPDFVPTDDRGVAVYLPVITDAQNVAVQGTVAGNGPLREIFTRAQAEWAGQSRP
jgi:hypothetical protein